MSGPHGELSPPLLSDRVPAPLVAAIAEMGPLLRAGEDEAERGRRLPPAAVAALGQAGLFRITAAGEVGGMELHPVAELEVIEAVTTHSSSAGWNLFVGALHTSIVSGYVSDGAAATLFSERDWAVVAGQMAPVGSARTVEGGLVVSGRYQWGSGINHASWVLGGARITGEPSSLGFVVFVVPKSAVTVLDNWHVLGVGGSGSYDYELHDVFVPDGFFFDFPDPVPRRGGARFSPPVGTQLSAAHMGFASGVARRALGEIMALADNRQRMLSTVPLARRETFHHDLGAAHVALSAARAHAVDLLERVMQDKEAGLDIPLRRQNELRSAATHITEVALHVAQMALRYGGGAAVRLDSPLQRLVRELLVAQSHVHVVETNYQKLGVSLLEERGIATGAAAAVSYRP